MTTTEYPRLCKPVRFYIIDGEGTASYITCDVNDVLFSDCFMFQWRNKLQATYDKAVAMTAGHALIPTTYGTGGTWHHSSISRGGDFMSSVRDTMQMVIKYTPNNAAYGLAFLNTGSWNGAQFETATGIVHDRLKEAEASSDPLLEWYTLTKKAKAAEETLLKRLKEALVEKTRCDTDIEFTDNTEALLAFMLKSTKNTVFLGHPARFAAYEACGLRFGPVLAYPELYLASLGPVSTSDAYTQQARMSDFPWVSKEQN